MKQTTSLGIIACLLLLTGILAPAGEAKEGSGIIDKNPLDLEFTYEGEMIDFLLNVYYFKTANENEYNVEVWYEIPNPNLEFASPSDGSTMEKLETRLILAINAFSEGEKIESRSQIWSVAYAIENEKDARDPDKSIMGTLNFTLDPGTYVLKLGITDAISQKIGIEKVKFEIPAFDKPKLILSSLKFADKIEEPLKKGSEDDIYLVDNIKKRIFPNLNKKYEQNSDLVFYYEVYNLATDAKDIPKFDITYYFRRIEKSEKEGEPNKIVKLKKQTVNFKTDTPGKISCQFHKTFLEKERKDKSGNMRAMFIPGQYEMIIELFDHLKKDDQKYSLIYNFEVSEN